MAFLLNSQVQGVSGKNEQPAQTNTTMVRGLRGAGPNAAASVASA